MREFTCIVCPRGCRLSVSDNLEVTGHKCKRGITYALSEVVNPTRTITSTVRIKSSSYLLLPVKTDKPVPKADIFKVMAEINKVAVEAPISINSIIINNVLGLDVNIIATRSILE